jgi:hypothetical protein
MEWASGRDGDSVGVRTEGRCDGRGEADTVWRVGHDCGQGFIEEKTDLPQHSLVSRLGFDHPTAAQLFVRDAGEVRFDIEDRSSVQHVEAANVELRAFAAKEFNDGEANRVRTARGASCEYAVRAIVDGRSAEQFESLGAVELPEDDEMGEAFDVGEAELKLWLDVENALGLMFYSETFGDVFGVCVGAAYEADLL